MYPIIIFFCGLETPDFRKYFNVGFAFSLLKKFNAGISLAIHNFRQDLRVFRNIFVLSGIPVLAW